MFPAVSFMFLAGQESPGLAPCSDVAGFLLACEVWHGMPPAVASLASLAPSRRLDLPGPGVLPILGDGAGKRVQRRCLFLFLFLVAASSRICWAPRFRRSSQICVATD